jgi:hypothetical protein
MPAAGRDEADGRVDTRVVPAVARGVRFWRLRDEVVIGYGIKPRVKSFSSMQIYHMGAGRPRAGSKVFCKFPAAGYH